MCHQYGIFTLIYQLFCFSKILLCWIGSDLLHESFKNEPRISQTTAWGHLPKLYPLSDISSSQPFVQRVTLWFHGSVVHFSEMLLVWEGPRCRKEDRWKKKKRNNFYLHTLGNTNPLNRDDGFPSIRVLTPAATFTIELRGYWREKEQSKSKRDFYTFSEL